MVYGAASDYRAASIVDAVGPDLTGGLELLMNNKLMAAEVLRRICPSQILGPLIPRGRPAPTSTSAGRQTPTAQRPTSTARL